MEVFGIAVLDNYSCGVAFGIWDGIRNYPTSPLTFPEPSPVKVLHCTLLQCPVEL